MCITVISLDLIAYPSIHFVAKIGGKTRSKDGNIDLLYLKLLTTHFYAFASFLKVKLGAHLSFADSGAIEATTKQSFNETCVS